MKRKKTSQTVEFKPVFEVLGIDENNDPEGYDDYDETDFIDDLKNYDLMLNTVNSSLDEYVRAYEKDPSDRTDIQTAYTLKMRILAGMAKQVGPLTQYGRYCLQQIKKCSREYESFAAPLTTRITDSNIESFSKVLTEDLKADVAAGKLSGLGAVRYNEGEVYGAGAIVYKVEYSPVLDGNVGRILWLYVHDDFRQMGIGDNLIAELLGSMVENGIDRITMNALTDDDESGNRLKAYLMSSWMFELETSIVPDALISVGNIKNISRFKDLTKGVKSLADIGVNSNGVKNALKRLGRPGYLSNTLLEGDYIDQGLSFYLGTDNTMTALLLAHRLPSGRIRVEYLKAENDSDEEQKRLLSAFFKNVSIQCSEDTLLYIPIDSEEIAFFIEDICPVQMGQYLIEGLLTPVSGYDDDLDVKTIEDLLEIIDTELA